MEELTEQCSTVCPSEFAPKDVSKDFRRLYPDAVENNQYAPLRNIHEVYYANVILHWRCIHCGEMWHRKPVGPFIRHQQIIDGRQVYA